jgi:hypothetical protein
MPWVLSKDCYRFSGWQKSQKCCHLRIYNMRRFWTYSVSRRPQCQSRRVASFYQIPQIIERGSHSDSLHSQKASSHLWGQPNPNSPLKDIAVIGGGITGLASAYYLSNELPEARITLYETRDRVGGWLQTKHIDTNLGNIVFEQGPRTLRVSHPAGLLTLELVLVRRLIEDFGTNTISRLEVLALRTRSSRLETILPYRTDTYTTQTILYACQDSTKGFLRTFRKSLWSQLFEDFYPH